MTAPPTALTKRRDAAPRRERRKHARPGEIVEAAISVFAEHGFEAARIEEVARRAGVSKGTVFVYFANKEELFRAVARNLLSTHLGNIPSIAADPELPFVELVPMLLHQAAQVADSRMPAMLRLLIAEGRRFPDIARVWYEEVVSKLLGALTGAIEKAQERGEIRPGDPRLFAFSIVGPMFSGVLFRQILGDTGAPVPDLHKLAEQHALTVLNGLVGNDG
jgi:AcrR family transcriptional regulator